MIERKKEETQNSNIHIYVEIYIWENIKYINPNIYIFLNQETQSKAQ